MQSIRRLPVSLAAAKRPRLARKGRRPPPSLSPPMFGRIGRQLAETLCPYFSQGDSPRRAAVTPDLLRDVHGNPSPVARSRTRLHSARRAPGLAIRRAGPSSTTSTWPRRRGRGSAGCAASHGKAGLPRPISAPTAPTIASSSRCTRTTSAPTRTWPSSTGGRRSR